MNAALNWACAALLTTAICAGTALDDITEQAAAIDAALDKADAIAQASRDLAQAREMARQHALSASAEEAEGFRIVTRVCQSTHGDRALVLRTTEGDWVCRRIASTI